MLITLHSSLSVHFLSLSVCLRVLLCVVACWCVCVLCVWCVWCGVCGSDDSPHGVSVQARADYAPNWVAEHLGASSRRPRHPFPALMTRNSWPCTCAHGPTRTRERASCHLHNRDIGHRVLQLGMSMVKRKSGPWNLPLRHDGKRPRTQLQYQHA